MPSLVIMLRTLQPAAASAFCAGRVRARRRVTRALDYIRAGDIYQANITQRFLADRPAGLDDYALFERLRALSPAPFAAFLNCGPRLRIASASPERFIRLSASGAIETRPIKGTRPRYADPALDAAAAAELVGSVKDRAENLMITDLLRNDLGRVAALGSVRVPVLYGLESFASVHHLVSVVTAQLRPGLGPVDLLRAACPGGSITGAPKIRAMEIIDELEPARRGAYCGSVAWIGFDGAMDSSIVIRSLSLTPDAVVAQAGGGIVADSDPAAEHEEMLVKVRPLLRALDQV
ncbi:anthranilate/para-aminobenzoate synthase component I [Azospirillum canadense]|nr:anthranilate/para-aminobenzoate synthase component I [Azospirillum canadense]